MKVLDFFFYYLAPVFMPRVLSNDSINPITTNSVIKENITTLAPVRFPSGFATCEAITPISDVKITTSTRTTIIFDIKLYSGLTYLNTLFKFYD